MLSFSKPFSTGSAKKQRAKRRGAALVEAALAVVVAASLVGLTISIMREQERRSDAILIGNEKSAILEASMRFVEENRSTILTDLFQSATTTDQARRTYTIADLQNAGLAPTEVNIGEALRLRFNQQYRLLIRGVSQNSVTSPAPTLELADLDPAMTGAIASTLIDGNEANGEIGLEAVLFTIGGTPVPPGQAGRVVDATNMLNAAFVHSPNIARGAGGAIAFPLGGFAGFPEFGGAAIPAGRFASIVSFGTVGVMERNSDADLRDTFARCEGINQTSPAYMTCLNDDRNNIYTDLNLTPSDTNGDGVIDRFPAITGATRLICANDVVGPTGTVDANVFLIDCATTRVNGILDVTGSEVRFGNKTLVSTRNIAGVNETVVKPDKLAIPLAGGGERDLGQGVVSAQTVAARGTIPVQQCPARGLTGAILVPRAEAHITALVDPWGRPISGSFATVDRVTSATNLTNNASGTHWLVRVRYTLTSDLCNATIGSPISIRDTFTNPNNPGSAPRFFPNSVRPDNGRCGTATQPNGTPNGRADIYEMHRVGANNFGVATVTLSCR